MEFARLLENNETEILEKENNKYKTVKQTTYLIVPFALKTNYRDAIKSITSTQYTKRDGEKGILWQETGFSRQRLFAHISHLIGQNSVEKNESIGSRLVLEEAAKSSLNLPHNRTTQLKFTPDRESFTFSLGNIELYLFETQVGFIVFDIEYPEGQMVNDIILSNYYLKKIYQYRNDLRYIKRTGRDQQEEVNISLCSLVEYFLGEVELETYFEEVKSRPSHAMVYSSALIGSDLTGDESGEKELLKYLFQMRKSFKESYTPAPFEYELDSNDELIQLFENSYWGVSLEGASHIAYLKNDDSDSFFKDTHASNVREVYFFLYVLALHQHYALQYFSILASRLPASIDDYLEKKKAAQKEMDNLKSRMVFFTLRCAFKQVSHISHQTSLYEMFRRSLRIEALMDELQLEIEALSSITEMEQSRRSKKIENIILFVTTIFVIIATVNDSMGITSFIDHANWPANKGYTPWISGILWTLIGVGVVYLTQLIIKLIRR